MNKFSKLALALLCLLPAAHVTAKTEHAPAAQADVPPAPIIEVPKDSVKEPKDVVKPKPAKVDIKPKAEQQPQPVEVLVARAEAFPPEVVLPKAEREWVPVSDSMGWSIILSVVLPWFFAQKIDAWIFDTVFGGWSPIKLLGTLEPVKFAVRAVAVFVLAWAVTKSLVLAFKDMAKRVEALSTFSPKLKQYLEKAGVLSALVSTAVSVSVGIMVPCAMYQLATAGREQVAVAVFGSKVTTPILILLGFFGGCGIGYTLVCPLVWMAIEVPYVVQLGGKYLVTKPVEFFYWLKAKVE